MRIKVLAFSIVILLCMGCTADHNDGFLSETDGIVLHLDLPKLDYTMNEEVKATVSITNQNKFEKDIYVPIPIDLMESIAAVMIESLDGDDWALLPPLNENDNTLMLERTHYEFVHLQVDAETTIQQQFLIDTKKKGKYILSAFIILDQIEKEQNETYQPSKQLITTINFEVK